MKLESWSCDLVSRNPKADWINWTDFQEKYERNQEFDKGNLKSRTNLEQEEVWRDCCGRRSLFWGWRDYYFLIFKKGWGESITPFSGEIIEQEDRCLEHEEEDDNGLGV